MKEILFVSDIRHIVKLCVASAFLKGERPVSVILLADPECGKTSILYSFNYTKYKNIMKITKPRASVLEELMKKSDSGLNYIVVPDLIRITYSSKSTSQNLISFLNSAVEEGITEISTFEGNHANITTFKEPRYLGLATALTRATISDRRKGWHKIGFFSRFLPVSYSYNKEQQKRIRQNIYAGELFDYTETLNIGKAKRITCNKKYPEMFEDDILRLANEEKLYGFRYAKQFRVLLMASALLRGSSKVTLTDVKILKNLTRHINMNYNEVLEKNDNTSRKKEAVNYQETKIA